MRPFLLHAVAWLSSLAGLSSPAIGRAASISVGAMAPAQTQGPEESSEESESRPFRIPDHAAAKSRMDRAKEHAAAGRWSEALAELQAVLEEHRGDLLGGEHPRARGGEESLQPVHPGAARRARDRLLALPPSARSLYRERHGPEAAAALERARERGDRGALAEVARRWPLTEAAQRAWWALGDLEMERGEEDKARSAWGRALAALLEIPDLDLARAQDWAGLEDRLAGSGPARDEPSRALLRAGASRRVALARAQLEDLESGGARSGPSRAADALHPACARSPTWTSATQRSGSTGPDPGPGSISSPGNELESWGDPFDLPQHPFLRADALFPARAGDALLVSTSLRLLALHAWSGALLWDSGEPSGWEDLSSLERTKFFEGIDQEAALVAPAAGGRVALAALQIPLAFVDSYKYASNVPVTTIIPDRRLYAFDLESGQRLWSHEPRPGWDGESGGFTERMSVAGPPIVCGTRVLAPCYRMQGRIDYHVGCFDLETGTLLWSTALISGQRELNMFGRAEHEFSAPPLVVSGDRVIALTQLGTIAALDLFTGELLWETLYDQMPLSKNLLGSFKASPRRLVWRNAPPVVAEGVVVATPFDSDAMIGVDLANGGLLWSQKHDRLETLAGDSGINLLVGARDGTVFVSGGELAALTARGGLRLSAPKTLRWHFEDEELRDGAAWRPVLAGDRIVLALKEKRIEIDVESGRQVGGAPWSAPGLGGNLILAPGEMAAVSTRRAAGWFDWDLLTARARAEASAHEDDLGRALALGRLLAERGSTEWQRGLADAARIHLSEAEAVLERALAGSALLGQPPGQGEPIAGAERPGGAERLGGAERMAADRSPAAAEMHRVLRAQARLRAGLADRVGALAALQRARTLAPDPSMLRDTLLEEVALLRGSMGTPAAREVGPGDPAPRPAGTGESGTRDPAYAEALSALDRCCADLPLVCDAAPGEVSRERVDAARGPSPALPRFVPMVGSLARRDAVPCEMPVGLWTLLERTATAANEGERSAEFSGLHGVLERYAEVELPQGRAGTLASERIGRLLRAGSSEGYEIFEERAGKLYDEALAAHDAGKLAQVGRLFPWSRAAERADDRRLAWAMESGDTAAVARIVEGQIPLASSGLSGGGLSGGGLSGGGTSSGGWRLSDASEREVRLLLRLSASFARAGNRELAGALLRSLAGSHGSVRSDLDGDGGRTLAELSSGLAPWSPPDPSPPPGRFLQIVRESKPIPGEWEVLGRMRPEDGAESPEPESYAAIEVARDRRLGVALVTVLVGPSEGRRELDLAFEAVPVPVAPATLGSSSFPWSRRAALAPGRILVATATGVTAIDAQGRKAWEWRPEGAAPNVISLGCAAGVAVASVDSAGGKRFLQALDARFGIELWRVSIRDLGRDSGGGSGLEPGFASIPLLTAGRVVLLPAQGRRRVAAIDLFTGREELSFDLETPVRATVLDDAWIEGDLLIVPWFQAGRLPEQNHVLAYDLSSGRRAWRIGIAEKLGASGHSDLDRADLDRADPERAEPDRAGQGRDGQGSEPELDSRELAAIFQTAGRTWFLERSSTSAGDRSTQTWVFELAPRIGALSPLPNVRVGASDQVLGLSRPGRLLLASTVLYLLGNREGTSEARLRAVDLAGGEQWSQPLRPGFEELYRASPPLSRLPQPALSDGAVLVAYSLIPRRGAPSMSTALECLDRLSGRRLSNLDLDSRLGRCDDLRFFPLGDALLVRGQGGLEVLR